MGDNKPRSSSKKRKDGKNRTSTTTGGSGKTKERVASNKTKSTNSNSKRQSERFHGVEDATPRVSHLRKTMSDSRVTKAKAIPLPLVATAAATATATGAAVSGNNNNNNSKKGTTGKNQQRLADAASAVTTQLSSALTKLADITTDFLYASKSDAEDQPSSSLVETSMETTTAPSTPRSIRLQLETTFSTLTSELEALTERNKLDTSFNSTMTDLSNSIVSKSPKKSGVLLKKQQQKAQQTTRHTIINSSSMEEEKKMESPQDSFSDAVTPDRSFDSQQSSMSPPPQLLEGRVTAKHSLHRPVPMLKQLNPLIEEDSFDTASQGGDECTTPTRRRVVYPEREDEYAYMKTTPMARMRHLEAQQAVTVQDKMNDVTPQRVKSQEQVKKEKQRKWRRRMKLAEKKREKELRELYDDTTSAVGTTATAPVQSPCRDGLRAVFVETTTSPVRMLQQMIRTRCGILEDALSFDSGDEEESEGSQDSEELVTTEDEEEESLDTMTSQPSPRESPPKSTPSSPLSRGEVSPASEPRASVVTPEERTPPQQQQQQLPSIFGTLADLDESEIFAADDFSVNEMITPRIELNDKSFIKAFIMELTKDGVPLLWHKEQPKANAFSRPCQVMSYLAGGSKGPSGVFEGPRLYWIMPDGTSGDNIALFDIRSLEKASPLQLQDYPFAIPGRSMVVRGNNMAQEWVFEAPNESEARRFIHGMRWVVARLAFNLIIGNLDVCCELLNVTTKGNNEERKLPQSFREEVQWVKAMNEVTHQLVEKSVFQTAE